MFTWLRKLLNKRGHTNIIPKAALTWEQAKAWMVLGERIKHHDWLSGQWLFIKDGTVYLRTETGVEDVYEESLYYYIGNPWDVV